ncbi:MAG TPA: GDP-mannose 4,6-dehydratase [Prolixibacteraceae bacterium]|nr:GDP-mannose 4,6-dehydratase [Prolixibacteraceae bacterium]
MIRKKVLVTGGAGFVGSHLCERLLNDGNEVVCLDNYFTGQKQNIVHLLGHPYVELVRHDVTMPYYVEVDDLIEGMIRMMATRENFTGPVNIGNPNEFTILEVAQQVIRLTGSKSKIVYKPLPSDDPTQRQPDISLAKKELDWEPVVQLEEGLTRTIDYFRSIM